MGKGEARGPPAGAWKLAPHPEDDGALIGPEQNRPCKIGRLLDQGLRDRRPGHEQATSKGQPAGCHCNGSGGTAKFR